MDVKKEPFDPHEEIKTEPDLVYSETVDQDVLPIKSQTFKSEVDAYSDPSNIFEFQSSTKSENVNEIKQEPIDCEVPKIEQRSDWIKSEHGVCETEQMFPNNIETELDNREVKTTDFDLNKSDIKQELVDPKTVSELLTTDCDLPTLKSDDADYPDYFMVPGSSKEVEGVLKPENNTDKTVSKKRRYPCPICLKKFSSSKSRLKHFKGHKQSFNCGICYKKYKWKGALQQHIKTHATEELFKCDVCSKGYKTKAILKKHLIIHTDEKPFKCDICFKAFNLKFTLQKHLMIHANKKPFKCDICSKGFILKSSLRQHLKIHLNEKPFKCDICFKAFTRKSSVKAHLIVHADKNQLQCDICSEVFDRKCTLKQHLIIHAINGDAGADPYKLFGKGPFS